MREDDSGDDLGILDQPTAMRDARLFHVAAGVTLGCTMFALYGDVSSSAAKHHGKRKRHEHVRRWIDVRIPRLRRVHVHVSRQVVQRVPDGKV